MKRGTRLKENERRIRLSGKRLFGNWARSNPVALAKIRSLRMPIPNEEQRTGR
jgi:hypothetical protein